MAIYAISRLTVLPIFPYNLNDAGIGTIDAISAFAPAIMGASAEYGRILFGERERVELSERSLY